jgi:hypothetical protein
MSQINLPGWRNFLYMKFDTQIEYSSASTHMKGFPPTFLYSAGHLALALVSIAH